MPKVMIVHGGATYARMFTELGWDVVDHMDQADLIQFCGGEDVSPDFYGELPHPTTHSNRRRDEIEAGIYQKALAASLPMAGICRGAQLLNVLNGGGLYQHVTGHSIGGTHDCWSRLTESYVPVTSTHHQMMRLGDGAFLEGWAENLSPVKDTNPNGWIVPCINSIEPEVVFYEATHSLCFQPHPEHYGADSCRAYYFRCLETYLGERLPYSSAS